MHMLLPLIALFTSETLVIEIQPLGDVPKGYISGINTALKSTFVCDTVVLKQRELPHETWYAHRNRYRADKLLPILAKWCKKDKIIGITTKDISTTKENIYDWGIFGLGQLSGNACIVSSFRLGTSSSLIIKRLSKISVHEVGHTLGLSHCLTKGCIMSDANGKISTVDNEEDKPCKLCKSKLGSRAK